VHLWVAENRSGFAERYARAREIQAHALADELVEIADDGRNDWMQRNDPNNPGYELNGEHIQRSRLRFEARRWLTSKILPKHYGDKIETAITGANGQPLFPALSVTIEGHVEPPISPPLAYTANPENDEDGGNG
jgi:hypothetical protein